MGARRRGGPQVTEVDLPGARREGGPQPRLDRPPTAGASGTSAATVTGATTVAGAAIGTSAATGTPGTSTALGTAIGPGPRPAPCPAPSTDLVIPHSPASNIFSSESSARLAIDFTDPRLMPRVAAIWASVSSPQ